MLPHREPADLDLVFRSEEQLREVCNLLDWKYQASSVKPPASNYIENYFNTIIPDTDIKVDSFIKSDIIVVDLSGYKLEHCRSIVKAKIDILFDRINMNISDTVYCKHREDLDYILPKLPILERSK